MKKRESDLGIRFSVKQTVILHHELTPSLRPGISFLQMPEGVIFAL